MFFKALHIIEAYLGSRIHVVHAPRRSNWETECADNLSRERTTGFLEKQLLSRFCVKTPVVLTEWLENRLLEKQLLSRFCVKTPVVLTEWLENPVEDWTLVDRLIEHVVRLQ
jgi:hypothetical protein